MMPAAVESRSVQTATAEDGACVRAAPSCDHSCSAHPAPTTDPGKRLRSSAADAAEERAMASCLPQDLVDLIVACLADETDLCLLLRLRAVCGAWGEAVSASFKAPRFIDDIDLDDKILSVQGAQTEPGRSRFRKTRIMNRMYFVLCRDCEGLSLSLSKHDDIAGLERVLSYTPSANAYTKRMPHAPRSLGPLGPIITRLSMASDSVNNDTMQRLAELLPAVRSLDVSDCPDVTDINCFARHALTELDIAGDCGVDTRGMSQLLYVRKLRMAHRAPALLDHIAGRLTELDLSHSSPAVGIKPFVAWRGDDARALVSSPDFVMQRLTKLDVSFTEFRCRDILTITPALTDLSLDYAKCPDNRRFTVPPGVPVRRVTLRGSNLQLNLEHCGDTLTELDVSLPMSGIGSEILEGLRVLKKLNVSGNSSITRLTPVADTLTDLAARGENCSIGDANLKSCTTLKWLACHGNNRITTIRPFIETLEHLDCTANIPEDEIAAAPRLVKVT